MSRDSCLKSVWRCTNSSNPHLSILFNFPSMTAEGLCEGLGLAEDQLVLAPELRERNFGALNLGPHERYAEVWEADADPSLEYGLHDEFGVVS